MDLDAGLQMSCVDFSVQYLAAAGHEDVVAEARVQRRGREIVFVAVTVQLRDGKKICHGVMTFQVTASPRRTPRVRASHVLLPPPAAVIPPDARRLFLGYVNTLGIVPLHEEPGRTRLSMQRSATNVDEYGDLHPGALASLVDIAAVTASWSLVSRQPGTRGSTIGMQISFPAKTTDAVLADAHVQQRSESLLFNTVYVTAASSGQLAAMGQVSYRLVEPWPDDQAANP